MAFQDVLQRDYVSLYISRFDAVTKCKSGPIKHHISMYIFAHKSGSCEVYAIHMGKNKFR